MARNAHEKILILNSIAERMSANAVKGTFHRIKESPAVGRFVEGIVDEI